MALPSKYFYDIDITLITKCVFIILFKKVLKKFKFFVYLFTSVKINMFISVWPTFKDLNLNVFNLIDVTEI